MRYKNIIKSIYYRLKKQIYLLFPAKKHSITDYHVHPTAVLYNKKNIILHKTSLIAEFVIIRAPLGIFELGAYSQLGPYSIVLTTESVKIGNNVMIAPHCVFASGVHEYRNLDIPMRFAGHFTNGPIVVEDDVWVGANCTILDNIKIGRGAVIGANSLVNRNVEPFEIVGGVPIKHLSSRLKFSKE